MSAFLLEPGVCWLNFPFHPVPGMPSFSLWWHCTVKGVCLCACRKHTVCVVWCVFVGESYLSISVFRLCLDKLSVPPIGPSYRYLQ